jgi:hypothetical protein
VETWQIVNSVIASSAFGLSLYNFVLSRRDKRPKLKVQVSQSVRTDRDQPYLLIEVVNPKEASNFVQGLSVPLRGGRTMVFPLIEGEKQIPCEVKPREALRFWVPLPGVAKVLQEAGYPPKATIKVVAKDGLGKEYKGKMKI